MSFLLISTSNNLSESNMLQTFHISVLVCSNASFTTKGVAVHFNKKKKGKKKIFFHSRFNTFKSFKWAVFCFVFLFFLFQSSCFSMK